MTNKRELVRVVLAGIVAAVAIACGEAVRGPAADLMRDAGATLADAGVELRDAGMHMLGRAAVDAGGVLEDAGNAIVDAGARDSSIGDARAQAAEPTVLEADCSGVSPGFKYAEFDVAGYSHAELAGATAFLSNIVGTSPYASAADTPDSTSQSGFDIFGTKARVFCGSGAYHWAKVEFVILAR